MKRNCSSQEIDLCFSNIRVRHTTLDWAHGLAGLIAMKADTFGTQFWIDDKSLITLGDRLIRALRLTGSTVDAFVSDISGHANFLHISGRAVSKPP